MLDRELLPHLGDPVNNFPYFNGCMLRGNMYMYIILICSAGSVHVHAVLALWVSDHSVIGYGDQMLDPPS